MRERRLPQIVSCANLQCLDCAREKANAHLQQPIEYWFVQKNVTQFQKTDPSYKCLLNNMDILAQCDSCKGCLILWGSITAIASGISILERFLSPPLKGFQLILTQGPPFLAWFPACDIAALHLVACYTVVQTHWTHISGSYLLRADVGSITC